MSEKLEALKQEAKDLGISFSANLKDEEKLQEKIDAYYKSQESSGDEIKAAVEAKEQSEEKPAVSGTGVAKHKPIALVAKELYEKAKKTVVVTIIDNDQRVNNQTTTCKANWTNAFYDMGTKIFPLNTPIEIEQGFVNVLKEVKIPHHVKNPDNNLSTVIMRPRYTIQVEDIKLG